MFNIAEKTDLNQISLTGARGIVLVGLLIIKPRSLEEIRKAFIDLHIMENENSDDMIRIDLNTIKAMGCEISRACAKTDFKYVIGKHPFCFNIDSDEINLLKKAYNQAKTRTDITGILNYDKLFNKIASRVCDETQKEALLGISVLKRYDTQMIQELLMDCKQNMVLELVYKKATSSQEEQKEIVAQKLEYNNDKFYIYGYDIKKQRTTTLLINRIKKIISKKPKEQDFDVDTFKVIFELDASCFGELKENEIVVHNKNNTLIVEGNYHNEFLAMQRVLSFGAKCVVIKPTEFKNTIINNLKEMRKIYEN